MAGRFQTIVKAAAGGVGGLPASNEQLNFAAHSVIIDNFTNQWTLERGFGNFVQPYWSHAIMPLNGPQVADFLASAPSGFSQPATNSGESYRITYFEDALPYNPGQSVAGLLAVVPSGNLVYTSLPNPAVSQFSVNIPAGINWLCLSAANLLVNMTSLITCQGNITQFFYPVTAFIGSAAAPQHWFVYIEDARDTSVKFTIPGAIGGSVFDVSALSLMPAPGLLNSGLAFPTNAYGIGTRTQNVINYTGAAGLMVFVNVGAGAGNVTVSINDFDEATGLGVVTGVSTAALTTGQTAMIRLHPGMTAGPPGVLQDTISRNAQIQAVVAGAALTFTVGYTFVQ